MAERENTHLTESTTFRENWRYFSPGSVYAAEMITENQILVGGSIWNRKYTPFNSQTRNAAGSLDLVGIQDNRLEIKNTLLFPSMVNSIVPTQNGIFVGCKNHQAAFNLFNSDLKLMRSRDASVGGGIYNAVYFEPQDKILAASRDGKILSLTAKTLDPINEVILNGGKARIWSLTIEKNSSHLIAGDYSGRLFVLNNNLKIQNIYSLTDYLSSDLPAERRHWEPSVFGITQNHSGQIIAGNRWGQITWFEFTNSELIPVRSIVVDEEISQLTTLPDSDHLLVGTRRGSLLFFNSQEINNGKQPELVTSIAPSYQKDNSIWSMSSHGNSTIISFADGQIISLN